MRTPESLRAAGWQEQPDGSFSKGRTAFFPPHVGRPEPEQVNHENEKQLQEQIANWLRLHDTWFTRNRMDRKTTNSVGTPDFLCAIKGIPVAIECKMVGNPLSPEQEQVRLQMQANGWQYWTVYRLEEVINGIKLIQETQP